MITLNSTKAYNTRTRVIRRHGQGKQSSRDCLRTQVEASNVTIGIRSGVDHYHIEITGTGHTCRIDNGCRGRPERCSRSQASRVRVGNRSASCRIISSCREFAGSRVSRRSRASRTRGEIERSLQYFSIENGRHRGLFCHA